ncbi:MAG: TIGR02646 family protein [Chitinophagales bacterium]|nr:TIGR02646 family protein [Chitinophagales bacterium]
MRKISKLPLYASIQRQIAQKVTAGKKYEDLTAKQKCSIRSKLLESQKYLCCYCECRIYVEQGKKNCHIEHFFEQSDFRMQGASGQSNFTHNIHSLDYIGMLASCEGDKDPIPDKDEKLVRRDNISCGHRKGQKEKIDYTLLLNPQDDISHLFSYLDGDISAADNCTDDEKKKVEYTIDILGLSCEKLKRRRIAVIRTLLNERNLNAEDFKKTLPTFLNEDQEKLPPFFSTLKENFSFLLP